MAEEGNTKAEKRVEWDKTLIGVERLKEKNLYEEPDRESQNGYYLGRPIIGRDTPINGGIYVGGGEREAIVVDDSKGDSPLNDVYTELLSVRQRAVKRGENFKGTLLSHVFDLVKDRLPYSPRKVNQVAIIRRLKPDDPVSLDTYIQMGGGVCRHQALLAAYLLERLKKEGIVRGSVSIDRNYVKGRGGHAWVRYVNSAGILFVIDPARELISEIRNVPSELQPFYERPKSFLGKFFRP